VQFAFLGHICIFFQFLIAKHVHFSANNPHNFNHLAKALLTQIYENIIIRNIKKFLLLISGF
jgi:hypothetical protein